MRPHLSPSLSVETLEARDVPATLFVSPSGLDTNPGTAAAPFKTLQRAADVVAPGDVVTARPGTYRGFNLFTSGTPAARITFRADPAPAAPVVVNQANPWNNLDGINLEGASFVTVDGFAVTGVPRAGIRAVVDQFVVIRNNNATDNGVWGVFTGFSADLLVENNVAARSGEQHGIYVSNSADRPVVRGNTVFENKASGIQLNADLSQGGDGIITNAVIENNTLRANGAGGGASINLDGVRDSDVRNNFIDGARASGIALFQGNGATGSRDNRVVNNTVIVDNSVNAGNGRWAVTISGGSTGNVLRNNVLFSTQSFRGAVEIVADSLPGLVSDYNAVEDRFDLDGSFIGLAQWRAQTGQDLHSVGVASVSALDALFVNRAGGNLHLAAGSAAVDAGTAAGAPALDFDGQARPGGAGVDIGADERVPAPPTVSAVPNQALRPNTSTGPLAFAVGDVDSAAAGLVVTAVSSNPALVPPARLVLGGSAASRTVTITPRSVRAGQATITLTVTDPDGLSATTTFTVTVAQPPKGG